MHCRVSSVGRQVLGALSSGICGKVGLRCIVECQVLEGRS